MHRFFIVIGIILTVISLFMSNYILRDIGSQIVNINKDIGKFEREIEVLWQEKSASEQHAGLSIILLLLIQQASPELTISAKKEAMGYIHRALEQHALDLEHGNIIKLNNAIEQHNTKLIDKINTLYGQKIEAEENLVILTDDSNLIQSWALFLYSLGLIFVLSHTFVSVKS